MNGHFLLSFLCCCSSSFGNSYTRKLLLQTTIYHIWRERNGRRHQQSRVTTDHMRRRIDKAVRNRISSLKYRFDHKYGGLLSRWFQLSM
ncbi:hypothetical protein BRARA_K01163 [Brassica rapa]|uniref:Secreted protein n=1 Tax=Brassica campestris TaxID=3711 RepID=A0A397L668_BRACM|nr:hypothetical protein BRARA_K01163 [Brassica rapa]